MNYILEAITSAGVVVARVNCPEAYLGILLSWLLSREGVRYVHAKKTS